MLIFRMRTYYNHSGYIAMIASYISVVMISRVKQHIAVFGVLLLLGCDSSIINYSSERESVQSTYMSITPPDALFQSRSIDLNLLVLVATVNGEPVEFVQQGSLWSSTLNVPENQPLQLVMQWFHDGVNVAQLERSVGPLATNTNLAIQPTDYDIDSLDTDGDSINNLTEIACGTNYTDPSDPGDTDLFRSIQSCVAQSDSTVTFGGDSTGGSGTTGEEDNTASDSPPSSVSLSMEIVQTKTLRFSWDASPTATEYRLLENADRSSSSVNVSGDIQGSNTSYDLTVPLYARLNADYNLEACNDAGCTQSQTVSVSSNLTSGVGFVAPSNGDNFASFGNDIALSEDGRVLVVSASDNEFGYGSEQGSILTYVKNGNAWVQESKIVDEVDDRTIGSVISLSADGSTLAIFKNNEMGGHVIVYRRQGSNWSLEGTLFSSNLSEGDRFGFSLDLTDNGSTLVVGAAGEESLMGGSSANPNDNSGSNVGAVYVFSRTNSFWTQRNYLKANSPDSWDMFGFSVDISGDGNFIVAGAIGEKGYTAVVNGDESNNDAPAAGAAYVFERSGDQYVQRAYLKASDTLSDGAGDIQQFGSAVAINANGSVVAVSKADFYSESSDGLGGVYVFSRSGSLWSQTQYLEHSNPQPYQNNFGGALAFDREGSYLAIAATGQPSTATGVLGLNSGSLTQGGTFVFSKVGESYVQSAYLWPLEYTPSFRFASKVAVSGDGRVMAVSDPQSQRVYLY
jgi:hypothetical protein